MAFPKSVRGKRAFLNERLEEWIRIENVVNRMMDRNVIRGNEPCR